MKIGADYSDRGRCEFVVWAPLVKDLSLKILSSNEQMMPMKRCGDGYWRVSLENISRKSLYLFRLENERERPDPASHFQPKGVHGPSQVIDHNSFKWEDKDWRGIDLSEMIMYELHAGTFTPEGDFDSIIQRLNDLKSLGINAVEIMPVAQFPGDRNWGYDGAYPFAVQNSYGGPSGFKRLINECHKRGIAVILDVVYNHLGPEGNYLREFAPYFTEKYRTPWGMAVNFDDSYSNDVRNYFIENALYWFTHYHIDALRLDAIHGITDMSAKPFLQELAERVERFSSEKGRRFYLIAESDLNDSRVIKPRELGGYGIDVQWCDDFHHSIHTLLTGEKQGYYADFGRAEHLTKSLREGFVYSGQYSLYRKRNHGNSSKERPANQFVVFSQNHDQVGNRMLGERLSTLISFEALKLTAGIVLLSPYIPLIFMGEEYGEGAPFLYFVSHSDLSLIEAVRRGRKEEFISFDWKGELPDPQGIETFLKSTIEWEKRSDGRHRILLDFYRNLIKLRKDNPVLSKPDNINMDVCGFEDKKVILIRRWDSDEKGQVFYAFNFSKGDVKISINVPEGEWRKLLDSADSLWGGSGTSLPDIIYGEDEVTLKGEALMLYFLYTS
jgi:maltooligosyltrehalose trehalohydrolase